ncbi:Chaperone protein HscA [Candidatus Ecksteinia adelgidicola]|nr:Chaperone protein HscA [Candidatus Ecksteinia adelgidicola]
MTLLKINKSSANITQLHRRFSAGIDLGTTNSLVATIKNQCPETVPDKYGFHLLPSAVFYQKDVKLVGWKALRQASKQPANTIISIKRLIGRSLSDIKKNNLYLPYKFYENNYDLPIIVTPTGLVSPEKVSADILKVLSTRVQSVLKSNLDGVVITVPAYFDDAQRQSTKKAANLAGLNLLRLLNEPTAAAIAYRLNYDKKNLIVVYDLGGGTFDVSILRFNKGICEVLAIGGDTSLGGDDFDYLLVDWIRNKAGLFDLSNHEMQRRLLDIAINVKIILSNVHKTNIKIDNWRGHITRNQFNFLIISWINRTLKICRHVMKDANLNVKQIQEVIMVGGSTRIPLVREQVANFFQRLPLISIDPDKVIAIGAAIQADILIGNKLNNNMLLLDVIPMSLGLEIMGGLVETIIPRNTTIPAICTQKFTTFKDNQDCIMIHVLQGENKQVKYCRSLAHFTLSGLPPLPASKVYIYITFQVDANGILKVTAIEKSIGIKSEIEVNPSYECSKINGSKIFTK